MMSQEMAEPMRMVGQRRTATIGRKKWMVGEKDSHLQNVLATEYEALQIVELRNIASRKDLLKLLLTRMAVWYFSVLWSLSAMKIFDVHLPCLEPLCLEVLDPSEKQGGDLSYCKEVDVKKVPRILEDSLFNVMK